MYKITINFTKELEANTPPPPHTHTHTLTQWGQQGIMN